jgi:hypothetical protein
VVQNRDAFISRHGDQVPLADGLGDAGKFGAFSDRLDNGGESLTLIDPYGAVIQQFTYDDAWYPETDGGGYSLDFVNPSRPDLEAWNQPRNWSPSPVRNGTPGAAPPLPGDANLDGVFDSSDLLLVLAAGEYEDNIPDNSTWAEGDWNDDGDFTSADLVAAMATGRYVDNAPLQAAARSRDLALQAAAVESLFSRKDQQSKLADWPNHEGWLCADDELLP